MERNRGVIAETHNFKALLKAVSQAESCMTDVHGRTEKVGEEGNYVIRKTAKGVRIGIGTITRVLWMVV